MAMVLVGSAALGVSAIPATADNIVRSEPSLVSGATPLPLKTDVTKYWCGTEPADQSWEADNYLAVNPANAANMVAAWQQDAADAIVVGYTTDQGETWKKVVPRTTLCTWLLDGREEESVPVEFRQYGTHSSALDPWVAFGQSIAYLTSVIVNPDGGGHALVVNRSRDGGRTWSDPTVLLRAGSTFSDYLDTSFVVADPGRPGRAYALTAKGNVVGASRDLFVIRTDDGGRHWANAVRIPSRPGSLTFAGQLVVLPDGTLVNVAAESQSPGPTGPTTLLVRRSRDAGQTWTDPSVIAVADPAQLVGASVALAPDGETVYVVWPNLTTATLMYSKSTDGGRTWCHDLVDPPCPGPVGGPVTGLVAGGGIAVSADGTLGVTFYDHRRVNPDDPTSNTDVWVRHSHDGGRSWSEDHVAGPFDQSTAPDGGDLNVDGDIGDYQGLVPIGDGFGATFVLAEPLAEFGKTDIFFGGLLQRSAGFGPPLHIHHREVGGTDGRKGTSS